MAMLLGSMAALLAWQINKFALQRVGERWILPAPAAEETVKTAAAVLGGADIFLTHLFFGVVEGFWEYYNRQNGVLAGLAALASHSVFGFTTLWIYLWWGQWVVALGAGILVHTAWNYLIIKYAGRGHNN